VEALEWVLYVYQRSDRHQNGGGTKKFVDHGFEPLTTKNISVITYLGLIDVYQPWLAFPHYVNQGWLTSFGTTVQSSQQMQIMRFFVSPPWRTNMRVNTVSQDNFSGDRLNLDFTL